MKQTFTKSERKDVFRIRFNATTAIAADATEILCQIKAFGELKDYPQRRKPSFNRVSLLTGNTDLTLCFVDFFFLITNHFCFAQHCSGNSAR